MGFDIRSLQRGRGPVQAKSRADEQAGRAALKYIDVYDLIPSEDNFYSMSAIEELASLIEISGGVKQPGLVTPLGGGKYRLIAGHRRRLASIFLVEQGKENYKKMPCMVEEARREEQEDPEETEKLWAIDEGILLIATNGQREKTDWERVREVTKLRELLGEKRRFQKIPGQTRKIIAEYLGTTPSQVGRYESIDRHLTPEFQEELAAGRVNISVAYELSILPEEAQTEALQEYRGKGGLSLEDVGRLKGLFNNRLTPTPAKEEKAPSPALPEFQTEPKETEKPRQVKTEERKPPQPAREIIEPQTENGIDNLEKSYYQRRRDLIISGLQDLLNYCQKMELSRDGTRNWGFDVANIMFAISFVENAKR